LLECGVGVLWSVIGMLSWSVMWCFGWCVLPWHAFSHELRM
jgi:hypothetical protein